MYIGFSTAYGHRMIGWADARLAYHFSGGPKPVRLSGWAHAKSCWADVARTALAAVISAGILLLLACWPAGLVGSGISCTSWKEPELWEDRIARERQGRRRAYIGG